MPLPDAPVEGSSPRPAVRLPSHGAAVVTTAVLLGLWLALTLGAAPIAPWIAAAAVQVEFWLGLDQNPPQDEE